MPGVSMAGDEDASGPKGVMAAPRSKWGALATEPLTFKWSVLCYVTSTPFQKQRRQTVHDRKRSHLACARLLRKSCPGGWNKGRRQGPQQSQECSSGKNQGNKAERTLKGHLSSQQGKL